MQIPKKLFPKISREDADKSFAHLIKYLFDYGFLQFGHEVHFIQILF